MIQYPELLREKCFIYDYFMPAVIILLFSVIFRPFLASSHLTCILIVYGLWISFRGIPCHHCLSLLVIACHFLSFLVIPRHYRKSLSFLGIPYSYHSVHSSTFRYSSFSANVHTKREAKPSRTDPDRCLVTKSWKRGGGDSYIQ